ncbi:hypothetical protein [Microvirga pudoricolor]|uniref:hypothetical protein n=1 Tax=Microvirga pudoricolor TaxID=2778729 RepID=UPI00194FDBD1|nr:hypothetical protein [Microvirga pudoricolor]MBM6595461.1 hypothetical protein [Microvirga pudoricolor]
MRALVFACCLVLWVPLRPAVAEDCGASRQAAAQRIAEAQSRLEAVLAPYEAAVTSGNLVAFESLGEATVQPWDNLLAAIVSERASLARLRCPTDGIPNEFALPNGWDMVRDIGALHIIEVDRSIAILNHQAGMGRRRPGQASQD